MTDRPDIPEEAVEPACARKYMQLHPRDHHRWPDVHPDFKGAIREKVVPLLQAAARALRKQGAEEAERERDEWRARAKRRGKALGRAEGQIQHWQHNHNAQVNRKRHVSSLLAEALRERDQALAKGAEEGAHRERERLRLIASEIASAAEGDLELARKLQAAIPNEDDPVEFSVDAARRQGAEEERERLREAFSDGDILSGILGEGTPAFLRERLSKAALDALDGPAPIPHSTWGEAKS